MKNSKQKPTKDLRLARIRSRADQGDIFFAKLVNADGKVIPRPIFIIGKNDDSNDTLDVLACKCTSQPVDGLYDIPIMLKTPSFVRTNKLYTVQRNQLIFQITHGMSSAEIDSLIGSAVQAISKKELGS